MGTNASVLQWTCKNCTWTNPTERWSCSSCGHQRASEEMTRDDDDEEKNNFHFEQHEIQQQLPFDPSDGSNENTNLMK